MKTIATLTILLCMLATTVFAEEVKPLRALMITGGGYHDYKNQKKIIAEGVSARANVEWTVVLENPKRGALPKVYENKDWAKGYDVIVHNECYAGYTDAEGIDRIVKDHLDLGVGSVMIHCAMHTFRNGKPAKGYGKTAAAGKVRFQVILANGRRVEFDDAKKLAASRLTQDAVRCCGK